MIFFFVANEAAFHCIFKENVRTEDISGPFKMRRLGEISWVNINLGFKQKFNFCGIFADKSGSIPYFKRQTIG